MTYPATIAERTAEAEQQDTDLAIDRNLRAALDVALMRFNARCELRGFGKWELMPVKETT